MRIFDVSLSINHNTIIYPGNERVKIHQYSNIPKNSVNESWIKFGCHTGTHVDAPRHINNRGKFADKLDLSSFIGEAKVLDLTSVEKEIHKEDLVQFKIEKDDIILMKTQNSVKGFKKFRKDFVHLKMDAAEYLVRKEIRTLGFDYLSVKKFNSDNEVHEILINNLTLFEGLNLKSIAPGSYLFIGLPLNLVSDGAPARVILIKDYNL